MHFVWTTWDREPWIVPGIEQRLYREIETEVRNGGCKVLALNGWTDHTHILTTITVTQPIFALVKQVKGASSHFVNEVLKPTIPFKWQPNYGAFTVSPWEVEVIKAYIENQKRHHAEGTIIPAYEESFLDFMPE